MQIIVSDSSALIDIKKGKLLEIFLDLPFELVIGDEMLADELLSFSRAEIALMRRKMTVATLNYLEEQRAISLQQIVPALTLHDCSAFVIAQREIGSILLTGDRRLRAKAEEAKIECHGILWIVEEIAKAKLTSVKVSLKALEIWRDDFLVRLPRVDLEMIIKQYRKVSKSHL